MFSRRLNLTCPGFSSYENDNRDTLGLLHRVHGALETRTGIEVGQRRRNFERTTKTAGFACISVNSVFARQLQSSVDGPQIVFELAKAPATPDEKLRVVRVTGDGRCMFRALALGLANNKNIILGSKETDEADQLRMACADAICNTQKRRSDFGEAMMAIKAEQDLNQYCKRITKTGFWGGEAELLVLSKMLKAPIKVYIPNPKGFGFRCIQEYGRPFDISNGGKRKPVRLLYNGKNHYDLLLQV